MFCKTGSRLGIEIERCVNTGLFQGLDLVTHLRGLHDHRGVGDGGHLDLALAGANGLDEDEAEAAGVEHRGAYYEEAGALRDMIPNHLLVLLGFVAMEPPNSFESRALRDEVNKVLDAIEPLSPEEVLLHAVRGQYGEGSMPSGEQVVAYRSSPGVDPQSRTETFAALKLKMDNWRWAGVSFYLRTGKRLTAQYTEIAIQFKKAPTIMFKDTDVEQVDPDMLVLRIQPDEGAAEYCPDLGDAPRAGGAQPGKALHGPGPDHVQRPSRAQVDLARGGAGVVGPRGGAEDQRRQTQHHHQQRDRDGQLHQAVPGKGALAHDPDSAEPRLQQIQQLRIALGTVESNRPMEYVLGITLAGAGDLEQIVQDGGRMRVVGDIQHQGRLTGAHLEAPRQACRQQTGPDCPLVQGQTPRQAIQRNQHAGGIT